MKTSNTVCLAALLLVAANPSVDQVRAQTFSEPATVFYGKVLGTGSAQDFLITQGVLSWTIQRADGSEITLTTSLFSFQNNTLSYRLDVPHSAFALGLDSSSGGIPLPPTPQTHLHKLVKVDGEVASLLGPAASAFTTDQLQRSSTYRMDLALGRSAADTDGDGMADWWEDLHGLDKQNPNDGGLDLNGDGISALQAYLQSLDPNHDYRIPQLMTGEIIVYPPGTTALLLDAKDIDSTPAQVTFTIAGLPNTGSLYHRNTQVSPENPDSILDVGSQFTLADVQAGRIVYDHGDTGNQPGSFLLEIRDENPLHAASTGEVQLLSFEPALQMPVELSELESQRIDNYLLASVGHVVMDGSDFRTNINLSIPSSGLAGAALDTYVASYGDDLPYVLVDGIGNDSLRGGQQSDVLFSGRGNDVLNGGSGADWFVFKSFEKGRKIVEDFKTSELDVLDLTHLASAPGSYVHQYLRIVQTGGVFRIQVDSDGNGAGFTNLVIELPGLATADADLYTLIENGRLLVGDLMLQPSISVAATSAQASENGPGNGVFTLTRRGSLDGDITVNLTLGGSAINGTDYATVLSSVVMPDGQPTVTVVIQPFADSFAETMETVELLVNTGSGYRVGSADRATVTIEDLLMQVEIEAIEPLAVKDTASPGTFVITRRDVINQDVLVRLTITGTAANGTDYNTISAFVLMPANSTVALINVVPKSSANLNGGMETVNIAIKADPAYRVSGAGQAQVAIIERIDTFAAWRSREFPDSEGSLYEFAEDDTGGMGTPNFRRYAFGLNAAASDTAGLPYGIVNDGRLVVTFKKPLGVSDVTYDVKASTSVGDWQSHSVPVTQISAPDGSSDPQRVYYQVGAEADGSAQVFIMVEAEWVP